MDHEKQIEQLLKDNPEGLTIQEIISKTNLDYDLVMKSISNLGRARKIQLKRTKPYKRNYHKI